MGVDKESDKNRQFWCDDRKMCARQYFYGHIIHYYIYDVITGRWSNYTKKLPKGVSAAVEAWFNSGFRESMTLAEFLIKTLNNGRVRRVD